MELIKVRVYKVGDASKYGIEFAGWYHWEMVKLVNKQLMSEGKATVKTVAGINATDLEFNQKYNGEVI